MIVALSPKGKYYWHEIHKRSESNPNEWTPIKGGTIDKEKKPKKEAKIKKTSMKPSGEKA